MGMTIDEAIPILHDMYNYYNDTDIDAYVGFDKEDNNAIKTALETMRKYQKIEDIYYHQRGEALENSLRAALEQEPTTKNNLGVDCISRTRAIERLQLNFPVSAGADNSKERYRYMQALADVQAIKELPSVTPIRPKGRWIFIGEENEEETRNGNFRYICSECAYSDVHAKSTEVPYCWHCGAKMVEPQESEE